MATTNSHVSNWGVGETKRLLPHMVDEIAYSKPETIWAEYPRSLTTYAEGFKAVTYQKFANAINGTAWWLQKTFGVPENFQTLAYIGPNDIRYQVLLIGAIKAGFKMFFTSPRNSIEAHKSLFEASKCDILLTTDPQPPPVTALLAAHTMNVLTVPSLETLLDEKYASFPYKKTYEDSHNDPIYVLHTSGSTGVPKPLTYTHDWVSYSGDISQLRAPDGFETFNSSFHNSRVISFLPPFHIAGLYFSVVNSIYNNSTVILPLPAGIPSAVGLVDALNYVKADSAFLAPTTIEDISKSPILLDQVSSKLDLLYWSGGNLPQSAGDAVAAKMHLYSCYGSSEYGAWPELREAGEWPQKDWNCFRIHPALGVQFRPRGADLFELVLPRGDTNNERLLTPFLHFPDLDEYPTNDLFAPHPTKPDFWYYRGRGDDIIVFLNGEKTNPITFEGQVSSHPEVSAALMVGSQRMEAALMVELAGGAQSLSPEQRAQTFERIWPKIEEANMFCPAHARIDKTHVLFADVPFLRAGKGTVQRKPTLQLYASKIDTLYENADEALPETSIAHLEVNAETSNGNIQAIAILIKNIGDFEDVTGSTDIFALGIDSVQILQLTRKLKEAFGIPVSPATIYLNPTPEGLESAIRHSIENAAESASKKEQTRIENMEATFQTYASQIDTIDRSVQTHDNNVAESTQTVILTGSTGTIGTYVLEELLSMSSINHVYCLNRSNDSKVLQMKRSMAKGLRNQFPQDRVTFVVADLANPEGFGLDSALYEEMLSKATLIMHNAWPINWDSPLSFFAPQLSTVVNLVDFAARANLNPQLLFLSSISAVLNSKVTTLVEESITSDFGAAAANGYGEAKLVSERLLDHAASKLSIPVTIVRICQLTGSVDKSAKWKSSEWLPSMIVSSKHLRTLPESLSVASKGDDHTIDWVPVDLIPPILLELAFAQFASHGNSESAVPASPRVFHVSSHHTSSWSPLLPAIASTIAKHLPEPNSTPATPLTSGQTGSHELSGVSHNFQTKDNTESDQPDEVAHDPQANGHTESHQPNGVSYNSQTNGDTESHQPDEVSHDPRTNAHTESHQPDEVSHNFQTNGYTESHQPEEVSHHLPTNGCTESHQPIGASHDPQTNSVALVSNVPPKILTVPFSEWLDLLRASDTINPTTVDPSGAEPEEDLFKINPGLKMLGFYAEQEARTRPEPLLDTSKARDASPSLGKLEAIKPEWMERWVEGWMEGDL